MEDSPAPVPSCAAIIQRCLETFSNDLSARYDNAEPVPPSALSVRRFTARHKDRSCACFISLRHYEQPLREDQLAAQRAIVSRLNRSESEMLCALVDCRIEPEAHYMVSTLCGSTSLHQVLRQQRRFEFALVCDLLTSVAEALETATVARWPRAMVDAHAIYLTGSEPDALSRPIKLIVPALPGPEMVSGTSWIPSDTTAFVLDLALLACELLGMSARGQRFRPLPQLSSEINQILRTVIEGGAAPSFESARQFVGFLRAGIASKSPIPRGTGSLTAKIRERPTSTASLAPAAPIFYGGAASAAAEDAATVRVTPPVPRPERVQTRLRIPVQPAQKMSAHLRLTCRTAPQLPIVGLCRGDELRIGRGISADYVTQFSPRNDERARLLSRHHLSLQRQGVGLWLKSLPGASHSFMSGKPIDARTAIGRFCRVSIAGEYDLEVRKLDTCWLDAQVWADPCDPPPPITGAVVLQPTQSTSALDYRTLWLFTDAAIGVHGNGALNLQPAGDRMVLGWIVTVFGGFWMVASENDGSISVDDQPLKAAVPSPLHHGSLIRIGSQEWQASDVAPD